MRLPYGLFTPEKWLARYIINIHIYLKYICFFLKKISFFLDILDPAVQKGGEAIWIVPFYLRREFFVMQISMNKLLNSVR